MAQDWSKFGTLSIYRNEFANRVDIRLGFASKDGGDMDFDLSPRSEAWREKLQAFFDAEVLPRPKSSIVRRPTSPT
jgi:hypothetical protein